MNDLASIAPVFKTSLLDVLTPSSTRSLIALKGMLTENVAESAAIPEKEFRAWLNETQPILPIATMNRLQAVLGTELGRLSSNRHHFFDINPGRKNKQALQSLNTLFPGGQIHQIVGPSAGFVGGKIAVYVLSRPIENAWLLIRHQKGWMEKTLDERSLPGLHWARQTRDQSRIPISDDMSLRLERDSIEEKVIDAICEVVSRNIGSASKKFPTNLVQT